jgi:prepilin-type N-terminal cleavage/methylation domain-containing protein/prepilin-type processing-associated H-X9-DG protein
MEMRKSKARFGFTLIELLVVIAIIAILAAILFPVFNAARGKARQTSCMSNLKQMGAAIAEYSGDWDERYPIRETPYPYGSTRYSWRMFLWPFVKNKQIFVCPSLPKWNTFVTKYRTGAYTDQQWQGGYVWQRVHGENNGPEGKKLSEVLSPSSTIDIVEIDTNLRVDTMTNFHEFQQYSMKFKNPGSGYDAIHGFVRKDEGGTRHSGGSNYLFCDSHVKWSKPGGIPCIDDNTSRHCYWDIQ